MKLPLFAGLAIAATLPAHGALIHEYTFNGNVNDQVGLDDGTLHGDATATGGTLTLDGNADWVSFGSDLIPFGSDFTVMLNAQSVFGVVQEFISQGNSGGPGFYLGPYGSEIRVGDNYGWTATPDFNGSCGGACTGVEAPSDNAWHSYAVTVSGSNGAFYIDGILRATKSNYVTNGGSAFTVFGAQFGGGQNENLNGGLRDVQIYDNALSAAQVAAYSDTPEPDTIVLLGGALAGLGLIARRKRIA
ncbi:MAG TPA: LamG domain-containing protein [Bryobacteraceae bacterium]